MVERRHSDSQPRARAHRAHGNRKAIGRLREGVGIDGAGLERLTAQRLMYAALPDISQKPAGLAGLFELQPAIGSDREFGAPAGGCATPQAMASMTSCASGASVISKSFLQQTVLIWQLNRASGNVVNWPGAGRYRRK